MMIIYRCLMEMSMIMMLASALTFCGGGSSSNYADATSPG